MVSSVNTSSAVSQVTATKAPVDIANKMKSFLSKAVSTLAQAFFIPQILGEARLHGIPKFAAIVSTLSLGPLPTLLLIGGIGSVKKLFTNNFATQEKQPLLLGKEKSL